MKAALPVMAVKKGTDKRSNLMKPPVEVIKRKITIIEKLKSLGITITAKARVLLDEIKKRNTFGLPIEHSIKV